LLFVSSHEYSIVFLLILFMLTLNFESIIYIELWYTWHFHPNVCTSSHWFFLNISTVSSRSTHLQLHSCKQTVYGILHLWSHGHTCPLNDTWSLFCVCVFLLLLLYLYWCTACSITSNTTCSCCTSNTWVTQYMSSLNTILWSSIVCFPCHSSCLIK